MLTDSGTEYCTKVEHHDYQLYRAINDIDHTKMKAHLPMTHGISARFHKTIRKKIYQMLEALQKYLDDCHGKFDLVQVSYPHGIKFMEYSFEVPR